MSFGSITIVGVGLMGGSLGLAVRSRGLADRVVGFGRDAGKLERARDLGAIDVAAATPEEAFAEADLAVICTPVPRIAADAIHALEHGGPGLAVTDVGSTKDRLVAELMRHPQARRRFIGAHPIAGSERSGVDHADAGLYAGAPCVLTPGPDADPDALRRVRRLWSDVGCVVREMSPRDHDGALALVSHLPHAVASALVLAIPPADAALAGGAYRDATRVAASDEDLWTGIFLDNREATLSALEALSTRLDQFRDMLARGDRSGLRDWIRAARQRRLDWAGAPRAGDPAHGRPIGAPPS
jgi:prephenate dehydrogenase